MANMELPMANMELPMANMELPMAFKRNLHGFLRIYGFYAFRPFWPLKLRQTTLKLVLEALLEVLEAVLGA